MTDPSEKISPLSASLLSRCRWTLTRSLRLPLLLLLLWVGSGGTTPHGIKDPLIRSEEVKVAEVLDGDTIEVFRSDESREKIRYLAISAPEAKTACGEDARQYHATLLRGKTVWIEWEEKGGMAGRDRDRRLLAYVYRDRERRDLVALELVCEGHARIDIRDLKDTTPPDDFRLKWLNELRRAQRDAAKTRRGCWRKPEWCGPADLVIAFIKFWGRDEIVELINRSEQPVSLEHFTLEDNKKGKPNTIPFQRLIEPSLRLLPSQAVLRIHSGPANSGKKHCVASEHFREVDCFWTGKPVWNNNGDRAIVRNTKGDIICAYQYKGQ